MIHNKFLKSVAKPHFLKIYYGADSSKEVLSSMQMLLKRTLASAH
jgi:hypothetical protein